MDRNVTSGNKNQYDYSICSDNRDPNIEMYFIKWKRVVAHGNKNLSELTQV